MIERQNDHHCLLQSGNTLWRIRAVQRVGPTINVFLACADCGGCKAVFTFGTAYDFERYAAEALMLDEAERLREERGAIPAAPLSRTAH